METFTFRPRGVCSRRIDIAVQDGIIVKAEFEAGCDGNLQGISRLIEGMPVEAVIEKLRGIDCSGRGTSCPDQLSRALQEYCSKRVCSIAK